MGGTDHVGGSVGALPARPVPRRVLLGAAGALGLSAAVGGCASEFAAARIVIATGDRSGVYYGLGQALARSWQQQLGLAARPEVRPTAGSVENLELLDSGAADVVFSQIDTAAEQFTGSADSPRSPRALARIYDDALHLVVPTDSLITSVTQLRGARVSVGAPDSGVFVIAQRVLAAAGLVVADLQAVSLGVTDSAAAMRAGTIDAFFWSGGVPTDAVTQLAASLPIRLVDLDEDATLRRVREAFPLYAPGTVPASTYGIAEPVSTLLVRNFLLVAAVMPERLALALVEALFAAQGQLAMASPAALRIDLRAAIGTQPVPLHPGAEMFYQASKSS